MIAFAAWIKRPLPPPPPTPTEVDNDEELLALLALTGYSVATVSNTSDTPYLKHLMGE